MSEHLFDLFRLELLADLAPEYLDSGWNIRSRYLCKDLRANLYSRLNYWIVFCGGEALSNPPALQGVEAPTEAVVTLTPTKFTFELEGEPDNAADLKLIIMASAPQSNGVTRAYGKAVQIAQPLEAVCEEYDIKEDFDNKHGAPNAAAPKVFMKYFFVNTKTGEKSGEMLTLVSLDENAPVEGE